MCDRDPEATGHQPPQLQGRHDQQRWRHRPTCHQQQIFGSRRKFQVCLELAVFFHLFCN